MKCVFTNVLISFSNRKTMHVFFLSFFPSFFLSVATTNGLRLEIFSQDELQSPFSTWQPIVLGFCGNHYFLNMITGSKTYLIHNAPTTPGLIRNSLLPIKCIVSGSTKAWILHAFNGFWPNDTHTDLSYCQNLCPCGLLVTLNYCFQFVFSINMKL